MTPPFPLIAMLLIVQALVCGCASATHSTAAGCHGPRRPANPNGSVLAPTTPAPATTGPPAPCLESGR